MIPKVIYSRIPNHHTYEEVWELQGHLQQRLIRAKKNKRLYDEGENQHRAPGYLLLCEHNPVFTLGKSGKIEHLNISQQQLSDQQTEFFRVNRGGDITYHGPGQITGYPILDLDQYYNDVHRYVRDLEEVVIRTLRYYDIVGDRVEGYTGVWITDVEGMRKICAIGVHMSRWVTLHGFALNVCTDLDYFNQIIPCGIIDNDTSVTSMSKELNQKIAVEEVMEVVKSNFAEVFEFSFVVA